MSSVGLFAECDMMAMLAKKGNSIAWINGTGSNWQIPNDPHDYFNFLYHIVFLLHPALYF